MTAFARGGIVQAATARGDDSVPLMFTRCHYPLRPRCAHCLDSGHVCEEHPEYPWEVKVEGHDGTAPGHGAGMPCPACCSPIPEDGTTSITLAFVPDWKRSEA